MIIKVFNDKIQLGEAAARQAADAVNRAISERGRARIVAATGASQFEFLNALTKASGVDWAKVEMFHLDEYAGLPITHPASFRKYLFKHLIGPTGIAHYHLLDGEADPDEVCKRIGEEIIAAPIDVAFVGIGENGHLAFNDPPADFETDEPYIVVDLDKACRRQQVGEGWFASLDDVPKQAISMTVKQILKAREIVCVAPDARKALAVKNCFENEISPQFPASILRAHGNTTVYLDKDSSALLQPSIVTMITMKTKLRRIAFYCLLALCAVIAAAYAFYVPAQPKPKGKAMSDIRLMTLDPGHFHAALVQKEALPGVSSQVYVYAPLGFDLLEHLKRVAGYNTRKENPTRWELEVHTGDDFLARMLRERPGNVVVIAGRNQGKIDRIKTCVENGLNALVDKPWIIDARDFPKLEATLNTADAKRLIAYDIMTERSEITTILQGELINDAGVFGTIQKGSENDPAVYMESVHHLLKIVSGAPNIRPAWFFDVKQQGEGVADVGTHLVDLTQWMLFPEQAIDYRKDVNVLSGKRWPTKMTKDEFKRVTNEPNFPDYLAANIKDDNLEYFCNGSMTYALRGVHVKLDVKWNYEAPAGGGDTHIAWFKGSKSRVEVRQAQAHTIYIIPNEPSLKAEVMAALQKRVAALQAIYPGVAVADEVEKLRVTFPDKYRDGHEAHFGQVATRFFEYLRDPKRLPAWEKPNMLAKYYTTTKGLELSSRNMTASR